MSVKPYGNSNYYDSGTEYSPSSFLVDDAVERYASAIDPIREFKPDSINN